MVVETCQSFVFKSLCTKVRVTKDNELMMRDAPVLHYLIID